MFSKGMVVQFIEKHKWAGCLGIITEVKEVYNNRCNGFKKRKLFRNN